MLPSDHSDHLAGHEGLDGYAEYAARVGAGTRVWDRERMIAHRHQVSELALEGLLRLHDSAAADFEDSQHRAEARADRLRRLVAAARATFDGDLFTGPDDRMEVAPGRGDARA